MKNILLLASLSLLVLSCAVSKTKLDSDGEKIKLLKQKENPNCNVVTKVVGENEMGSEELATNHVRNLAADEDGDSVYIEETITNGNMVKIHATVYQCNDDD